MMERNNLRCLSVGESTYWPSDRNKQPDIVDIAKIFQLFLEVDKNRLLPNHLFNFRQRHSTLEQTGPIVRGINEALENKL
jgi:hypothetical protein